MFNDDDSGISTNSDHDSNTKINIKEVSDRGDESPSNSKKKKKKKKKKDDEEMVKIIKFNESSDCEIDDTDSKNKKTKKEHSLIDLSVSPNLNSEDLVKKKKKKKKDDEYSLPNISLNSSSSELDNTLHFLSVQNIKKEKLTPDLKIKEEILSPSSNLNESVDKSKNKKKKKEKCNNTYDDCKLNIDSIIQSISNGKNKTQNNSKIISQESLKIKEEKIVPENSKKKSKKRKLEDLDIDWDELLQCEKKVKN